MQNLKLADLAPESQDIGFDSTTRGSIIVKSSNSTVDVEGRDVKQTTL